MRGRDRGRSEADWWVCLACLSLNNLSARRCYSCGQPRLREPMRASQWLGYRPVVDAQGRVRTEPLHPEAPRRPSPRPIREPVRRSILEVAPPLPYGARMTYVIAIPVARGMAAPSPGGRAPAGGAPGGRAPAGAAPLVGQAPARPVGQGPAPGGTAPPVGQGPAPGGTAQPVGHGPPPPVWPHWRELLDGPRPDAARLRHALEVASSRARSRFGRSRVQGWEPPAMEAPGAAATHGEEAVPWPEEDLASQRRGGGDSD
jgi:hypothetical protein